MQKFSLFIAVVLALLVLSGCGSSNPAVPESTTDQSIPAPEETEKLAYEVQIGDSLLAIKDSLEEWIITEFYDAVQWKDSKGYHIACAGEDGDSIYAIVSFSDDLQLLEAEGLEPIEPLTQMEEWLGKTEDEFIAVYGPSHFHQPSRDVYCPAFISKDGTVFQVDVEVEHGTIVRMHSFSLDSHHSSTYRITTPEEVDTLDYEVPIGSSLRTLRGSLENSMLSTFNAYVTWKDKKGYHIACTGDDWDRIYAIVSFSDDLQLLEAEGLEPIEPLTQMEEWLGKTEDEFIALYGPYHFQPGSGNYMPSYISKDGNVYWMTTELGTIVGMHSFSIDERSSEVYYLPQYINIH